MYYMNDEFIILGIPYIYDHTRYARYVCISSSSKEYSVMSNNSDFDIDDVVFYIKLHMSKKLPDGFYGIKPDKWVSVIELT